MLRSITGRDGSIVMLFRSPQIIAAALFSCVFLWFTFSFSGRSQSTSITSQEPTPDPNSSDEHSVYTFPTGGHLMGHNGIFDLTNSNMHVSRVQISVSQSEMKTFPLLQALEVSLPASTQINVNEDYPELPIVTTNIRIPRLVHSQPDASTFIFGVSTTYERLLDSLPSMSHWLSNSNTRLIAAMEPSLDPDLPTRVLQQARSLSIPLGTVESRYTFLDRYFSLIRILHDNRTPSTKWYVLIDDDTFFLDLAALVSTMRKYDPETPFYIGALTEDFQQMAVWGYMAYGGGGIFLSHTLVDLLLPHYDACFAKRNTGDRMVADCIYQHTTTRFTWEPNLHQLDLHGDMAGFYEALRPQPLNLHHWKEWFPVDMANLSAVAAVCGNACLLQKFRFQNGWVLTNGFSLVKYSEADAKRRTTTLADGEVDVSMERTWDLFYTGGSNSHFEHTLGPVRRPDEGKLSFRMESAIREEGRVRQLYVKRKRKGVADAVSGRGKVEGVVEVEWNLA